jgi:hypothetical protein
MVFATCGVHQCEVFRQWTEAGNVFKIFFRTPDTTITARIPLGESVGGPVQRWVKWAMWNDEPLGRYSQM